jgi:hypothetical protein
VLDNSLNDSNKFIKGPRSKIEFIVAQHPRLENDCLFADVLTGQHLLEERISEPVPNTADNTTPFSWKTNALSR